MRGVERERLPNRRAAETFGRGWGSRRSAFYPDGRVGEVFVTNHKAGSAAGVMASDAAMVAAIALRYGVSPEVLRRALMRDPEGRASSPLGRKLDQLAAEEAV
jgi:hypothetical protein